jgi:hypothetical protein
VWENTLLCIENIEYDPLEDDLENQMACQTCSSRKCYGPPPLKGVMWYLIRCSTPLIEVRFAIMTCLPTAFPAHGVGVNLDRTATGSKTTLAVFAVNPTGTPSTTLAHIANATNVVTPTDAPQWWVFNFAPPIQFVSGQSYMLGMPGDGGVYP